MMKGLMIYPAEDDSNQTAPSDPMRLIARVGGLEVIRTRLNSKSIIWLTPGNNPELTEFFYLLSGELTLMIPNAHQTIRPGTSFCGTLLEEDLSIQASMDSELLYISSRPIYDALISFTEDLNTILEQINQKDHVTAKHSKKVMTYTVMLYRRLFQKDLPGTRQLIAYDDLVAAALFHDVGKCFVPDHILKKDGRLTKEEYEQMKKHVECRSLLEGHFGETVIRMAQEHHERLDGSGYPQGLKGDEISFGAKILAVADSFDAMTAGRSYAHSKQPLEAILELESMTHCYDADVVQALRECWAAGDLSEQETAS